MKGRLIRIVSYWSLMSKYHLPRMIKLMIPKISIAKSVLRIILLKFLRPNNLKKNVSYKRKMQLEMVRMRSMIIIYILAFKNSLQNFLPHLWKEKKTWKHFRGRIYKSIQNNISQIKQRFKKLFQPSLKYQYLDQEIKS